MKLISNCFDNQKSVNIQEQMGGVIFFIFLLRKYIFRYGHSFHTRQKGFQMSSSHRTHLTPKNSTRALGCFSRKNRFKQRFYAPENCRVSNHAVFKTDFSFSLFLGGVIWGAMQRMHSYLLLCYPFCSAVNLNLKEQ
jgi:hypothetical protein